ncbi:MAG: hypothetical protein J2P35_16580, partial [Actinobacteria bacterium]|nr:hypothetical protein [Actinomycetota bacterium]
MAAEGVHDWGAPPPAGDFSLRTATVGGSRTGNGPATVAELCEEFDDVCRAAVDPLEIAAALEFEGIGDRTARGLFGATDVFDLASQMYERVERQPPEPPQQPADPWQSARSHPFLHGILYGLPAACYPGAAALLIGPGAITTLIVALLVAWGLSQGVASLGYQRLGAGDQARARGVLRAGLAAGLAIAGAAMAATGFLAGPQLPVLLFGAGEAAYMLGACVLLVIGAERWLLPALAPGVLASMIFLLLGRPAGLAPLCWALLAATPVLAVVIAVRCTRPGAPPARPLPAPGQLRSALAAA